MQFFGNMELESTINPNLTETGGSGYGLVQWTPQSVLEDHAETLGLSPYTNGNIQLQVLLAEIKGENGIGEWYTTSAFISNYYNSGATSDMIGITGAEFLSNSMGWTSDKLAILFMAAYERPSYDPDINHYSRRESSALKWFEYIGGTTPTPEPIEPIIRTKKVKFPWVLYGRKLRNNRT